MNREGTNDLAALKFGDDSPNPNQPAFQCRRHSEPATNYPDVHDSVFVIHFHIYIIYIDWKRSLKIDGCGAKPTVLLGWFTPLLRSQSASRRPDAGIPCHGVKF